MLFRLPCKSRNSDLEHQKQSIVQTSPRRPLTYDSKRGASPSASLFLTQERFFGEIKSYQKSAHNLCLNFSKADMAPAKLMPSAPEFSTLSTSVQHRQEAANFKNTCDTFKAPGLPREILDLIIHHLDTNDIKVLSLTSRAMSLTLGYIPYVNYSSWKSHLCHIYRHKTNFFANMCDRCEQEWRDTVMERAFIRHVAASPAEDMSSCGSSYSFPENHHRA